jgi:prevent-host-death family protein
MASVGVRELRLSASELLRRVERGETIEITDRGRPVAMLTPLPAGGPLNRLLASGQVDEATGDIDDLPRPIPLPEHADLPSMVLARLRQGER